MTPFEQERDNMAMERYAPCLSDDHDYHKGDREVFKEGADRGFK